MGKALIIVESPAKIKTLRKFLGSQYLFESSVGHIRDLPQKEFGIDIEHDFEPKYVSLPDKKEVIQKLIKAAKQCDIVYLSPDPDREGEAIAWHIANILPSGTDIRRATFNSITKEAVIQALENPRSIDQALVDAQQTRRLLDRIVGYKISPILNRRIQRGKEGSVSAGRVQSVALKLVVDREKEIELFIPIEYWNLGAVLQSEQQKQSFQANVHSIGGKKLEKELVEGKEFTIVDSKEKADVVVESLKKASYEVTRVERKEKKRHPVPPFITSTMQQEASRHHGFSASRTMKAAQNLYEGIDLGNEGTEGLITYMRTDSVRTAPEAQKEARDFIAQQYGTEYLPESPKQYSSKKTAQDAHEAIRPTNLQHPPELVKNFLSRDQFLLYSLIWKRFIASQMVPAIYDTVSADVMTDQDIMLRATGSILKFSGFLAVYEEKTDDEGGEDGGKFLPVLEVGQKPNLLEVLSEQAFTRPPPRFTEASLVKELEKSGVGRPSTYASIMNKIQSRAYTTKEGSRLKPTELGIVLAQMLEKSFPQIMNIGFTAAMEDDLELIAEDQKQWKAIIKEFWDEFIPTVELAEKEAFVPKIMTDLPCPKCGAQLQKIWSKSKYFYGCSKYPDCDYTVTGAELAFNKADYSESFDWDQSCPLCSEKMTLRHGRYGPFLGCSKYPDCKGIVNIPKKGETFIPQADLPSCPAIGCEGRLMARKSRFGKIFYSCSTFPDCDVIVNKLEDLGKKYVDHPKTAYVKKTKTKKGAKGKSAATEKKTKKTKKATKPRQEKPSELSEALSTIVGQKEMGRSEVLKKVWDYIKAHQLQDAADKRVILPDAALGKVFGGTDPVKMFQVMKLLAPHISKVGDGSGG